MLDLIDLEPPCLPGDRPLRPDAIVERWAGSWGCSKQFTYGVACAAAGNALVVVRLLYPSIRMEVVNTGIARGLSDAQIVAMEQAVEESAMKLADDLDLFSERENI